MKKIMPISVLLIVIVIIIFTIPTLLKKSEGELIIDKKDNLLSKSEEELKKNMNDPDSYQFVSFEEDFNREMKEQRQIEELKMEEFNMNDKFFKLTYRGKNKMGALILTDVFVKASNEDLFFLGLEDSE